MTSPDKLGTRIRTYRERLGLTTEDLAKNAGLDLALLKEHRGEHGPIRPSAYW